MIYFYYLLIVYFGIYFLNFPYFYLKILCILGIVHENLRWMLEEGQNIQDSNGTFHGILLMDEMSIQEDLQVVKRGKEW